MNRFKNFAILFLIYLLSGMVAVGIAADVNGPYINAQSTIEYTTFDQTTWLYAVNAKDRPQRWDNSHNYSMLLFNRMEGSSGSWLPRDFVGPNGTDRVFNQFGFPCILGYNRAFLENDSVCMTVAAYLASEMIGVTKRRPDNGNGLRWSDRTPDFIGEDQQEDRYARLVVSRTNPAVQWMGCYFQQDPGWERLVTTEDGWVNATNFSENILPTGLSFYSLAIDDRANPLQGVSVLTPEPFEHS